MDKYKELYDYAMDVLLKERDRFNRADEKAAKFSGMSVFLIGVNAFFSKTIIDTALPPHGSLEWLMVVVGAVALSFSASGWYVSNSVIRLSKFRSRRLDQDMLDFFRTNKLVNVYYALTKQIAAAYRENLGITDRKYHIIRRADMMLRISVAGTLALALLYAIYRYSHAVQAPVFDSVV
jgi:hypothetical protein